MGLEKHVAVITWGDEVIGLLAAEDITYSVVDVEATDEADLDEDTKALIAEAGYENLDDLSDDFVEDYIDEHYDTAEAAEADADAGADAGDEN